LDCCLLRRKVKPIKGLQPDGKRWPTKCRCCP
jgi:hypothetical protein